MYSLRGAYSVEKNPGEVAYEWCKMNEGKDPPGFEKIWINDRLGKIIGGYCFVIYITY